MVSTRHRLTPVAHPCNVHRRQASGNVMRGRGAFDAGITAVAERVFTVAPHDVQDSAILGLEHRQSAMAIAASIPGDSHQYNPRRWPTGSIENRFAEERPEASGPYTSANVAARSVATC